VIITNKIKIAQIRWGENIGGVERVLRDIAHYSNRDIFDQRFFFLARGGPYEKEIRIMGYPFIVIPARNGYDLNMRIKLASQLRDFRPDVVIVHGVPPLIRPIISFATGTHQITFDHGEIEINRRKGKPWLNYIKSIEYKLFCERIIVNSAANAQLVIKTHRLHPNRVQVIPLGIDLSQFQFDDKLVLSQDTSKLILGYVGRIQNYDKGTDLLPLIAQQLLNLCLFDFRLDIIGDGPDRQNIENMVKHLGVEGNICFLGKRDDVPELLRNIDILIVPSRTEAFGLVAIEALATGTRVVASAIEGLNEILNECPEAALVPVEDVPGFATAVLSIWKHYGKQRSILGRRYVEERFDARRMTNELENICRETLG